MRKSIYFILASLAIASACTQQEMDQPDPTPAYPSTSILARIDNGETKTAYTIDEGQKKAIFSWANADQIDGIIRMGSGSSAYYTGVRFVSQSAGTDAEFLDGQISGDRTVAELKAQDPDAVFTDWALYPSAKSTEALEGGYKLNWTISGSSITADLPSQMVPPAGNPLAVVPLIGRKDAGGVYVFTPLTAVLAVPVENLPDDADFIRLTSADAALSGGFTFALDGGAISQSNVSSANTAGMTLHFSNLAGNQTFYFPLPAGEIPAGLTLTVGNSSDPDACMTISTKKALTMKTGVITRTPALVFTPVDQQWTAVGAGLFKDDFLWQQLGMDASAWVDVTIEQSGLHPEKFRINSPYVVAAALKSYTLDAAAEDYFIFSIADDGSVTYPTFKTGVNDSLGAPMMLTYSSNYPASVVQTSAADNLFLEIQFGSVFTIYDITQDPTHKWSRANVLHLKRDVAESWTSLGNCQFIDNYIWSFAGVSGFVERDIQQNSHNPKRFRIQKPYPADDADSWFVFDVSTPTAVTSEDYYTGTTVKDDGSDTYWKAVVKNGAYNYDYCNVMSTQSNGLPLEVQIGPCYRDSEGLFYNNTDWSDPAKYYYEVGKDNASSAPCILIVFPHPTETWTSLGTGHYMDEWLWKANGFAPYDVEVEVWRSSLDANRYRVTNPYPVANTAFKRTAATTAADEYMYLQVDPSTGYVTFGSVITGMTRGTTTEKDKNFAIADAATWEAIKTSGSAISASDSKVIAGSNTAPEKIQLYSVYYDSAAVSYFYTNSTLHKYLWFPGFYHENETWINYCEGTYVDGTYDGAINGSDAIGTVDVTIQQSSLDPKRFRVANPYRANVASEYLCSSGLYDEYLYFNCGSVNDYVYSEPFRPGVKMNPNVNASYELGIYHPVTSNLMGWSQGGNDFAQSSILSKNGDGTPSKIRLGLHYFDIAGPNPGYCYTRQGNARPDSERIIITFGSTDKAIVTPYQQPLKAEFHNPVAKISLPSGTLEKLVVKITGIDLSIVTGLRLYMGGWMDAAYVAPDSDGVVTMTSFTNPTVSGDIDLNFWITGNPMGSGVHFIVQQVVVDGVSLPIQQEDVVHLGGIVVNTGGDTELIRGEDLTVTSFRIPALVTSTAGTLIAAYDVRYDGSGDLQNDIDVGVKRSTDGGKTWSNLIIAMDMGLTGYEDQVAAGTMTEKQARQNNGIGDPCLLVDENTGRLFCFAVWAHGHKSDGDSRCLAWATTGFDIASTPQFMMVYSDDDGITWSEPINITQQIKKYDWRMTFQGPGRGITMKDGTLVIPIQHQEGDSKNMHGLYPLNSGIAYSTDHGLTWHAHNFAHTITSESAVAEIEPGVLLLTMRDETDSHYRRNFITTDLGRTWTEHSSNGKWLDSTCEASLLHVNAADNSLGKDLLLFSNPHNTVRSKMTIHASLDKGGSFAGSLMVDSGGSLGYSCLTMVDPATVGILYESSRGNIFFQAVPLVDIVPSE